MRSRFSREVAVSYFVGVAEGLELSWGWEGETFSSSSLGLLLRRDFRAVNEVMMDWKSEERSGIAFRFAWDMRTLDCFTRDRYCCFVLALGGFLDGSLRMISTRFTNSRSCSLICLRASGLSLCTIFGSGEVVGSASEPSEPSASAFFAALRSACSALIFALVILIRL